MRFVRRVTLFQRPHGPVVREVHFRHLLFYAVMGLVVFHLSTVTTTRTFWTLTGVWCVALPCLAMACRVYSWQLTLDLDEECWRREFLVPGIFSFQKQEWPLAGHVLAVGLGEHHEEVATTGCAVHLLPFPLGLVADALSPKTVSTSSFLELVLIPVDEDPECRTPALLARIPGEATVQRLLWYFHASCPEAVSLPESMND